jgi:hypothetical protein
MKRFHPSTWLFCVCVIVVLLVAGTKACKGQAFSFFDVAQQASAEQEAGGGYEDPNDLSNPILWVYGDDLAYSDGDNKVTDWADKSSAGNDLEDDNGRVPGFTNTIASINNHSAVSFREVDALYAVGASITPPYTVFVVARFFTLGTDALIGSTNLTSGYDTVLRINSSGQLIARGDSVPTQITDTTGTPANTWRLITAHFDGADSFIRTNGVQAASGTVGSDNMDGIGVGGNENSWFLNGEIASVVIDDADTSLTDIVNTENYLSNIYQFFTW